jgi:hypothetical protein
MMMSDLFLSKGHEDDWRQMEMRLREAQRFLRQAEDLCSSPHLIPTNVLHCLNGMLTTFDSGVATKGVSLRTAMAIAHEQMMNNRCLMSTLESEHKESTRDLVNNLRYYKKLATTALSSFRFNSGASAIEEFIAKNQQLIKSPISNIHDFHSSIFNATEPSRWYECVEHVGTVTAANLTCFLEDHAPDSIELFLLKVNFNTPEYNFHRVNSDNQNEQVLTLNVNRLVLNVHFKLEAVSSGYSAPLRLCYSGSFFEENKIPLNIAPSGANATGTEGFSGQSTDLLDDFFGELHTMDPPQ